MGKLKATLLLLIAMGAMSKVIAAAAPIDSQALKALRLEVQKLREENAALRAALKNSHPTETTQPSPQPSSSESPTSTLPPENKTPKTTWKQEVALNVNLTEGNKDSLLVGLSYDATRKTDLDKLNFKVDGTFSGTEGKTTSQRVEGRSKYDREIDESWYWLVLGSGEYDEIKGIDYRFSLSPGAGYHFFQSGPFTMDFEAGPALVFRKLQNAGNETNLEGRLANITKWEINDRVQTFHNGEFLIDSQDTEDWLLKSELGAESSITESLSLRMTVENRFNNQPSAGKDKYDLLFKTSVVFGF